MKRATFALLSCFVLIAAPALGAQRRAAFGYPPDMPGAKVEVYKNVSSNGPSQVERPGGIELPTDSGAGSKTVGDVKLNIYIFEPAGHKPSDRTPAIIFFFGGGWTSGSPVQFQAHCQYLASRGMVAMAADYRVASRHRVTAKDCVADAKSAVRWVRANAQRLGIDPNRIAAGGGSAGGHLAACTGTIAEFDEPGEDRTVSSVPNALVLFNPAVVLATEGITLTGKEAKLADSDRVTRLAERMGVEPIKLSPYHHVKPGVPPTIIFHGTADPTVPFQTVELFTQAMTKVGNVCRLVPAEGRTHGFFNYGRNNNADYRTTVRTMDEFLAQQGFLQGAPTIE